MKEIKNKLQLFDFYNFVLNCDYNHFCYDRKKSHLYKITNVNGINNTYLKTYYDCGSKLDILDYVSKSEVLDILNPLVKSYIRSEKNT